MITTLNPVLQRLTCRMSTAKRQQNLLAVLLASLDTACDNVAASQKFALRAVRVRVVCTTTGVSYHPLA